MTKPSRPSSARPNRMFRETDAVQGPEENDFIHVIGRGDYIIRQSKMVFNQSTRANAWQIVVQGSEGEGISTIIPAEDLLLEVSEKNCFLKLSVSFRTSSLLLFIDEIVLSLIQ